MAVELEGETRAIYEDLREKDIETVMPKENNDSIAVLKGEFKGEIGKMISRDRKKDQVIVQVGLTEIVTIT